MLETVRTAWRIKELRERILFTLAMFCFRPGPLFPSRCRSCQVGPIFEGDTIFGFMNIIGGDNLSRFTIFALGIMPYINASIIMNLLTLVIPKFKEWARRPEGRKNYHS